MQEFHITDGWFFKERNPAVAVADGFAGDSGWLPATVPGTVHQDLLAAGRIPDPFVGLHERDVQWIGERDWLYRCRFTVPADSLSAPAVDLCLDGLDTVATIWLNGRQLLQCDNMFIPLRVSVTALLQAGENELRILFGSAPSVGRAREAEHGPRQVWNGDASRVYVRKAQYHWGWDWGPCLLTAGPWKPIRLEAYAARIVDLHASPQVTGDGRQAIIPVTAEIATAGGPPDGLRLRLRLFSPSGEHVDEALLLADADALQHTFVVEAPRLWWPRSYGDQPMYRLTATVERDDVPLDRRETRLGLRHLRLAQEPLSDAPGTSFVFVVNGVPLFCGGANWIPADSFLPRIGEDRYRALLQQAADANMTMLRVWGGGIYEIDAFYDICDDLGLLVWQDFMFACGMYPAHPAFQASVREEAEATVRRLRQHPCIVLWCGNNEDYQVAESAHVFDPTDQRDLATSAFPARALYERLLPEVCARLDPDRPYWPASPYGGSPVNDPTVGDRHVWDIWHGSMAEYREYGRYAGRFVSEFGMQALPDGETIRAFAPPDERYGQSETIEFHNKAGGGARRLAVYLADTVRAPIDFPDYLYATQLVQAEALATAIRDWRRRWRGPGREGTAGALIWQLEDCWPGVSWAIIDYFERPKPSFYAVRRALARVALGVALTADSSIAVWAVNGTLEIVRAQLELASWSLAGELLGREQHDVTLAPNQATDLATAPDFHRPPRVLAARLLADGAVLAREALWPEPFKYLTFLDPELTIERIDPDRLRLRARRPAKGVLLAAGTAPAPRWSDNMLDLLPDDAQIIEAPGLGASPVRVRWLGAPAELLHQ